MGSDIPEFIKLSKINDLNRNNVDGLIEYARYAAMCPLISNWTDALNDGQTLAPLLGDLDGLIEELQWFKAQALKELARGK